ncbi:MAG: hypothetical protein ACPL1A_05585 [Candidatus Kapaibacteriota bacterium]
MSRINKKFKTAYKADEMKNWVSVNILPHPLLGQFVNSTTWNGNSLFMDTKFGTGNIILNDYLVEVDFELNVIGSMASKTIEETLDKEFKKLESKN